MNQEQLEAHIVALKNGTGDKKSISKAIKTHLIEVEFPKAEQCINRVLPTVVEERKSHASQKQEIIFGLAQSLSMTMPSGPDTDRDILIATLFYRLAEKEINE